MYGHMDRNDRKMNNRQFQEASSLRKACNDTQFFWDMVNRNRGPYGTPPMRRPVNKQQEEKILFGKAAETVEHGFIDDSIPVERSGPRADEIPVLNSFAELEGQVPPFVSESIQMMRYVNPTPIQKHAVPLGLAGVDLMCCAQTGSGKTFSFLLPVVTAMDRVSVTKVPVAPAPKSSSDALTDSADTPEVESANDDQSQPAFQLMERISVDQHGALPLAVVLAPTRELASQIHLDARRLMYGSNLKAVCVYGGNDLRTQLTELSTGCDLIVATPGRLNDLVDRGCVSLSMANLLVLDEADRMLDMGFEPQIRRIIQENDMPPTGERQTFLFSATFPDEIQTLAREFLHNYVWIGVGRVGSTVENIKQQILCSTSDPNDKIKLLLGAIDQTEGRTLVFVQKRRTASWLCDCLRNQCGIRVEEIHGDRTQAQREHALKQFRDGQIRILVATDVAARGLDVPAVTHVIQFDLPLSSEDFDTYVHRIGRTGRAGMSGMATALFVPGRELGEGNGKIAPQILRLLQENNQEIPDWFANLDDHNPGYNNRGGGNYRQRQPYGGGGGYGGAGGGYPNQQRFGWRDVRGDQNSYQYTESSGGGGYGAQGAQGGYYQGQGGQQSYQRGGMGGRGGGGGGYGGGGGGYGQQQSYQHRGAYGADAGQGYNRRPAQPDYRNSDPYGAHTGYAASAMNAYASAPAQYGAPAAPASAYGASPMGPADPAMGGAPAAAGYYDPYSGAYVSSAPAESASGGYGAVDGMGAQFSGMSMQQQQQLSAYGGARGAQGAGYPRQTPGGPAGMQAPPRAGAYGRPMDSAAAPYVPNGVSAAADPYGYPQPPQQQQYSQYQQKAPQGYGSAPAGGYAQPGMQQQAMYGGAQHQQQMRPPTSAAQGYPPANMRYQSQQPQQGYGAQPAMPQPYDPQYFGSPSDTGAEHASAPAEHSN